MDNIDGKLLINSVIYEKVDRILQGSVQLRAQFIYLFNASRQIFHRRGCPPAITVVEAAARSLKSGKTSGIDNVSSELAKNGREETEGSNNSKPAE